MKNLFLFLMLTVTVSFTSFAQSVDGVGCTDDQACNYCPWATEDSGTCDYSCVGCMDTQACNFNPSAFSNEFPNGDVVECDNSCHGCMDENACNYDSAATLDWDFCHYDCIGCMDESACNFNGLASWDHSIDPETGEGVGPSENWEVCDFTCVGCMDPNACDYNQCFDENGVAIDCTINASCDYITCKGCMAEGACDYCVDCTIPDYCDWTSCVGCTDAIACNFDSEATQGDDSCEYETCAGCIDNTACNFDVTATIPADCDYLDECDECGGSGITGCMDEASCNYNADATCDDGSCFGAYDACGVCDNDETNDDQTCTGCSDETACNYVAPVIFETPCDFESCYGCIDDQACNYNQNADGNCEDGFGTLIDCTWGSDVYACEYVECYGCTDPLYTQYNADNPAEFDNGTCVTLILEGCMDAAAFNYNADATVDDGSCVPVIEGCFVEGACNYDATVNTPDNVTCEYATCLGCTNTSACNYNPAATIPDDNCEWDSCVGCADENACNYAGTEAPFAYIIIPGPEGTCDYNSCGGCTDLNSCNYDPTATINGGCQYADPNADCDGNCLEGYNDFGSGCAEVVEGCMDAQACNYDAAANTDSGACDFDCYGCSQHTSACNYDPSATDPVVEGYVDADGNLLESLCEWTSCVGCMDEYACDYDPAHTIPDLCLNYSGDCYGCSDDTACNYNTAFPIEEWNDGSCTWTDECGDCDNDPSNDGVIGCMDELACNYNADATCADTSCTYADESGFCEGCTEAAACNYNPNADISDDTCEYTSCIGCTDATACNYAGDAIVVDENGNYVSGNTIADDSCDYTCIGCMDALACNYDNCPDAENGTCTLPDESCTYTCYGCTDGDAETNAGIACNYNAEAWLDDGSCEYETCYGCTDEIACNYDETATYDDGLCDMSCYGCMNPAACNFGYDYYGNESTDIQYPCGDVDGDGLDDCCDFDICVGCMDATACDYDPTATVWADCVDWTSCVGCLQEGFEYPSGYYSPYENYDVSYTTNTFGNGYVQDGNSPYTTELFPGDEVPCIPLLSECGLCADGTLDCFNVDGVGCMDFYAVNYDANALEHDPALCLYYVEGCMNETACNYNEDATEHIEDWCVYVDGICETCSGETDGTGTTVNNDQDGDDVCDDVDMCEGFDDSIDADGDTYPDECDDCPEDASNNTGMPNWWLPGDEFIELIEDGELVYDQSGSPDMMIDSGENDETGSPNELDFSGEPNAFDSVLNNNGTFEDEDDFYEDVPNPEYNANYGGPNLNYNPNWGSDIWVDNPDYNPNYGNVIMVANTDWQDGFGIGVIVFEDCDDCEIICDDADILGCMDNTMFNYDSFATWDDGSCYPYIDGCIDETACDTYSTDTPDLNVDPNTQNDDMCCYNCGCMDDTMWNYDENACFDDGSCIPFIYGCTDAGYGEYDATANTDDGSCGTVCGCAVGYNLYTVAYSGTLDNTFTISNSAGEVVLDEAFWVGEAGAENYCWEAGDCYTVAVGGNTDAIGWNVYECNANCGLDGSCENNESSIVATSMLFNGENDSEFGWCVYGCTDASSCGDYNAEANMDDGTCCYNCGCTNPDADNFSMEACWDDDTCEFWGCTDPNACDYDSGATIDTGCEYCYMDDCDTYPAELFDCDGECLVDVDACGVCGGEGVRGCMDDSLDANGNPLACNYDPLATCDEPDNALCDYGDLWYLDMDANGIGNSCSGDDLVPGTILACEQPDDPILNEESAALYPDAQYVAIDDPCLDCDDEACTDLEESVIGLSIYPNPASDVLNIEFNSNTNNNVTIEFVNAIGQVISSDNFTVTNGLLDIEMDMTKYAKGIYQVSLISNTDVVSKMLMVE